MTISIGENRLAKSSLEIVILYVRITTYMAQPKAANKTANIQTTTRQNAIGSFNISQRRRRRRTPRRRPANHLLRFVPQESQALRILAIYICALKMYLRMRCNKLNIHPISKTTCSHRDPLSCLCVYVCNKALNKFTGRRCC